MLTMAHSLTWEEVGDDFLMANLGESGHSMYSTVIGMLCVGSIFCLVKLGQLIYNFFPQRMSFLYLGLKSYAVLSTGVLGLADVFAMVGLVPLGSGLIVRTAVPPVMSMLVLLALTVQILWVAILTGKWIDGLPVSVEECNLGAKVLLCSV